MAETAAWMLEKGLDTTASNGQRGCMITVFNAPKPRCSPTESRAHDETVTKLLSTGHKVAFTAYSDGEHAYEWTEKRLAEIACLDFDDRGVQWQCGQIRFSFHSVEIDFCLALLANL